MFVSNNRASFHLWCKENLVEHLKVSKYYENDCRYIKESKRNFASNFLFQTARKMHKTIGTKLRQLTVYKNSFPL